MKSRFAKLGALGAAAGLAVALVAGSAAMAASHGGGRKSAPPPVPTSSYSCATFSGLKLTQSSVSYSGVALSAGQVVTANVSPYTSGDNIFLTTTVNGLNLAFYSGPASTGYAFRAPASGVYNLSWTLRSSSGTTVTSPLSWSFQCS